MKFFNTKYLTLLVFSIVLFGSCEETEMVSPNIEKTKRTVNAKIAPIIISNAGFTSVTAPFTIPNFTIEDEIIMLTANFNGLAESTDFYLTTDGNVEDVDGVDVINLRLIKNPSNNTFRGNTQLNLQFDLSPLHNFIPNSVYLNIEGIGMINYSF